MSLAMTVAKKAGFIAARLILTHTLCMPAAKALASMHICQAHQSLVARLCDEVPICHVLAHIFS